MQCNIKIKNTRCKPPQVLICLASNLYTGSLTAVQINLLTTECAEDLPFLMRRLVTLLRASRGERWKNLGDKFGGSVSGFLESLDSHGLGVLCPGVRRSRCSMEAGRGCCLCRGYQPRPGPPASRKSSAPTSAWLSPPVPSATPVACPGSGPVPTRL